MKVKRPITLLEITSAACILCMTLTIGTMIVARQHGMDTFDFTVSQAVHGITHSPVPDKLPDDLKGSLILYYRFGCSDCEGTYDDIRQTIRGYNNVYWVCTRTPEGNALLDKYPVEKVPAGVYIANDGSIITYNLYYHRLGNPSDPVMDPESMTRLLSLVSEQR